LVEDVKRKLQGNKMLGGDKEHAKEKENPLGEEELPITVKRVVVPKLQG